MKKVASVKELADVLKNRNNNIVSRLIKIAAQEGAMHTEDETDFDEKPGDGASMKADKEGAGAEGAPPPVDPTEDQGGEVPPQEMPPEGMDEGYETPEEMGARAARAFLGPNVFAAAAQGDPTALNLLAQTAAQIAAQTTEQAGQQLSMLQQQDMAAQQEQMAQEQAMAQQQQMQPTPPPPPAGVGQEEVMADQIAGIPSTIPPNKPSPAFN